MLSVYKALQFKQKNVQSVDSKNTVCHTIKMHNNIHYYFICRDCRAYVYRKLNNNINKYLNITCIEIMMVNENNNNNNNARSRYYYYKQLVSLNFNRADWN